MLKLLNSPSSLKIDSLEAEFEATYFFFRENQNIVLSYDNFVANVVRNSPRGNQPLIGALHVSTGPVCCLVKCISAPFYLINDTFFNFNFTVSKCALDLVDDEKCQTPLHKAASRQRRTICRMLVNAGASLTRKDHVGNTPRLLALKAKDSDLAKFLENQERLQIIASDDHETAV
ncbi:uncharacterized protein LOC135683265 [Rhopilema esculentum]|uniref:uncharacterized protein LOC135683265 n=1 Tax=Rhopilema esculentum TaxID=499914 RepID=UPI0031D65D4E